MRHFFVHFPIVLASLSWSGCGSFDLASDEGKGRSTQSAAHMGDEKDENAAETPRTAAEYSRTKCRLPPALDNANLDLPKLVGLINQLPRPLSIDCLIDALPRPLKINATSSALSVQPAVGESNPRVFIASGELYISFALSGDGLKTVEFSQPISDTASIKAELAFPITSSNLVTDDLFGQVLNSTSSGTKCSACHSGEVATGGDLPPTAFTSKAIKPFDRQDVSLDRLRKFRAACTEGESLRCAILDALVGDSTQTVRFEFPAAMPTFF